MYIWTGNFTYGQVNVHLDKEKYIWIAKFTLGQEKVQFGRDMTFGHGYVNIDRDM